MPQYPLISQRRDPRFLGSSAHPTRLCTPGKGGPRELAGIAPGLGALSGSWLGAQAVGKRGKLLDTCPTSHLGTMLLRPFLPPSVLFPQASPFF